MLVYVFLNNYTHIYASYVSDDTIVNFCNGTKTGNKLSILYTRSSSSSTQCRCTVTPGYYYILRSLDIRSSQQGGGAFNIDISSTNDGTTIANETVDLNEDCFDDDTETDILLTLYSLSTAPSRIWIEIDGMVL